MATSPEHWPARAAGDAQGLSGDEAQGEVFHGSHSNWLEIQELKGRMKTIGAFYMGNTKAAIDGQGGEGPETADGGQRLPAPSTHRQGGQDRGGPRRHVPVDDEH